jgi:hypothetical protein
VRQHLVFFQREQNMADLKTKPLNTTEIHEILQKAHQVRGQILARQLRRFFGLLASLPRTVFGAPKSARPLH